MYHLTQSQQSQPSGKCHMTEMARQWHALTEKKNSFTTKRWIRLKLLYYIAGSRRPTPKQYSRTTDTSVIIIIIEY